MKVARAHPHEPIDVVVSAREASEQLGISERTIRRWIALGRLTAVKRGRSFEIRLRDAAQLAGEPAAARPPNAADLLELRGRYLELLDHVVRLEAELAEERRRAARLEAELELRAA